MRPWSNARLTVAAALIDGGGTTAQLATRTGLAQLLVMRVLDDMVRAGDAAKACTTRVAGVRRPVPVYERTWRVEDHHAANDDSAAPLAAVMGCWGRGTAWQPMEAAM